MLKAITASALLLAATAAPANATCTQANLAGEWELYFQGHLNGGDFGDACTLIIAANGTLIAPSNCADTLGRVTPLTGSLKLLNAPVCNYTGKLTLTKYADVNDVERTTLSPDRGVLSGVAVDEPSGIGYAFTMIRSK